MLRAARTLVFLREGDGLVGHNYLTGQTFACSADLIAFLEVVEQWSSFDEIRAAVPLFEPAELAEQLQSLIDVSALIARDSDAHTREEAHQQNWKWGVPAALFHQSVQDRPYVSIAEATELQKERLKDQDAPELLLRAGTQSEDVIQLERNLNREPLALMARRRTRREPDGSPLDLDQLSSCLFAGLGITGSTTNDAGVTLPLGMTPSGGARNPFEAYVFVQEIIGLATGIYHYSARDHALTRIKTNASPSLAALAGGQEWAEDMPCMVVLVGHLERPMWKYHDANAYRVVLIEAGHIGQNIMLAATHHGLSACPTAALDHRLIQESLQLECSMTCTPVYALTLSRPAVSGLPFISAEPMAVADSAN